MTAAKAVVKKPVSRKAPVKKAPAKPVAVEEEGPVLLESGNDLPFEDDDRPIREQVNDHEFCAVLVYVDHWGTQKTQYKCADWQYDWFDTLEEAEAWAKDVRVWASNDCQAVGDTHYAVAVITTGYPLEIKSVTAHGYVDNDFRLAVCRSITRGAEKNLFAQGVTSEAVKPRRTPKGAKKGIVAKGNTPAAKGARPKPVRKPSMGVADAPTPIVRSKGFRAKVRGARGAA